MGFDIDNVNIYYKGEHMTCSQCIHAASKNRFVNTMPSIHTCMNETSGHYLEDMAWSDTCNYWELMEEGCIDSQLHGDIFDDTEYYRLIGMMIDRLDKEV